MPRFTMASARTAGRTAAWVVAAGVLSFAVERLAMQFTLPDSLVAVVYPKMGLMVALALLVSPWIVVGAFLAELVIWTGELGAVLALWFAASGVVQILVLTWCVRRFAGGRAALRSPGTTGRFAGIVVAGTTISATCGVAGLYMAGYLPPSEIALSWLTWWAADIVALLLLTPLFLVFAEPRQDERAPWRMRVTLAVVALAVAIGMVAVPLQDAGFIFAMLGLPVVGWAAARFGSRTVTIASLAIAGAAFAQLLVPWRHGSADLAALLEVQIFVALAAAIGLIVAAYLRDERLKAQAAAEAKFREVNETRNRLLHTFAHELNNPLTPVRLELESLQSGEQGPLTGDQVASLSLIDRNMLRLSRLVRDLRDVGHLQAGEGLRLSLRDVDVSAVVRDVAESYRVAAEAKNVRLECAFPSAAIHRADPDRLAQVTSNLLDNALKYSPRAGVVSIRVESDAQRTIITVGDQGIGLEPHQMPLLFRPFGQVQREAHQKNGTGLGLHIVRGIVQSHGGHLECSSEGAGKGATFIVTLPHLPPPAPATAAAAARPGGTPA